MTNLHSILKSRDITLPTKVGLVKAMVFPVVMYGCESSLHYKVSWAPKRWCFWTVGLEKTLERPLDRKEIQPVHPKGHQSRIFIGGTDAEAATNTLATWCEKLTHWKRTWCWERLKAGGEGDDRGWDGWMASPTRWTWVWASSGVAMDREAFTVHGAENIPQWLNSTLSTPSTNHSINCTSLCWHKRALLK